MTNKIYVITIENPLTEEVSFRAVYARKMEAFQAYKTLEKTFTDKTDELGLIVALAECHPNKDYEYIPMETLISCVI